MSTLNSVVLSLAESSRADYKIYPPPRGAGGLRIPFLQLTETTNLSQRIFKFIQNSFYLIQMTPSLKLSEHLLALHFKKNQ